METLTKEVGFQDKLMATTTIVEEVKSLVVTNSEEHASAGEKVNIIRGLEKELEEEYKAHPTIIEAKKLQALKGDLAKLLEDARKSTKAKMIDFEEKEEAKRRAEEERLRVEAQKKADEETLAAAEKAEKEGKKDEAESIIQNTVVVPTVVLPKEVQKVKGHSYRTIWAVRVDDTNKLIDFVTKNSQFKKFLLADETALRKYAEAVGDGVSIPGVTFSKKKV